MFWRTLTLTALAAAVAVRVQAAEAEAVREHEDYGRVVRDTAGMVGDRTAQGIVQKHGLNLLNLTWEDTGRFKGSAVGPNISDMTIQMQEMDPRTEKCRLTCMPVIRYANFSDKTADIAPERFFLLVGNEDGRSLRRVSLKEYLGNFRQYLSEPKSWKGEGKSLAASRDTHVLVSAQACFLPVPKGGKAEFNPVILNYQSYKGDPAVLAVLATRDGTSATVIDNVRDGFAAGRTWGQRLFFNMGGKRCVLTGQRLSDFRGTETGGDAGGVGANREAGLNLVMLIQVPLKQKRPMDRADGAPGGIVYATAEKSAGGRGGSDVEAAVIGHGRVEGPFTEVDGLDIERDPKYPVRVTVQYYKATSNGVVTEGDIAEVRAQIDRTYKEADYVGSLVVEGETGRPTEHDGPKFQPPEWWEQFWQRHEKNTGETRQQAVDRLIKLLGRERYRLIADDPILLEKKLREMEGK